MPFYRDRKRLEENCPDGVKVAEADSIFLQVDRAYAVPHATAYSCTLSNQSHQRGAQGATPLQAFCHFDVQGQVRRPGDQSEGLHRNRDRAGVAKWWPRNDPMVAVERRAAPLRHEYIRRVSSTEIRAVGIVHTIVELCRFLSAGYNCSQHQEQENRSPHGALPTGTML